MMKRFDGRVAIVTGAAQGIGKAIAAAAWRRKGATRRRRRHQRGRRRRPRRKAIGGKAFAVADRHVGDPASVSRAARGGR